MKLFPWRGFVYELRRGLLSIPLLVLTALIILAAFGILAQIASSQPAPSNFPEESGDYYFTGGEYHFEFYAYTQSGVPIPGAIFTVMMYASNETVNASTISLANATGTTGSSGMVQFAVPLGGSNYTAVMQWTAPNRPIIDNGPGFISAVSRLPPGVTMLYDSTWTATIQITHHLLLASSLLIYYPGPNGTGPPNYQVYWAASQNESSPPTSLPESDMHRLGVLTSLGEVFPLVVPGYAVSCGEIPAIPFGPPCNNYLQVELFTTTGQMVAMDTNQTAASFFPPPTGTGTSVALGFGGIFMVYLVPLMAILATYSVYGRDRLTGILEGALARPVSRLGLASSRYLAVIVALCIAVTLAMASLEGLVYWVYGGFLSLDGALTLFAALLVEIGAFTGITFLLSHVLRSAGSLVGISLGLYALFSLGGVIIAPLIGALTGAYFTEGYQTAIIHLDFLDPVQFFTLAQYQLLASVPNGFGPFGGGPTAPSAFGITLGSLIATGLAWAVLPLVGFFYAVRHWD
jgi:ABC-type transport system involved in multi-copper enzyme maturation permease subunit